MTKSAIRFRQEGTRMIASSFGPWVRASTLRSQERRYTRLCADVKALVSAVAHDRESEGEFNCYDALDTFLKRYPKFRKK